MQSTLKSSNVIILQILLVCCSFSKSGSTKVSGKIENNSIIRFGIIADIQYCDCEASGSRYYRNSLQKLDECVDSLNKAAVQFTINLGDLVDRDISRNLDSILIRLDKLNAPTYNLTGNHDYGGIKDNALLYQQLGMPGEYYSISKKNWCFIMLNTNEISSYANVEGTEKEKELEDLKQKIKEESRPNGAGYNGGISKKQMQWLRQELEKSQQTSTNVLIFSHHPLYGVKGLTALNDVEITELLSEYPAVKGVISGHHHTGAFEVYKGIPFITTEGMIETKMDNAFGVVTIYPDKIEIKGIGRTKSYTIQIKEN